MEPITIFAVLTAIRGILSSSVNVVQNRRKSARLRSCLEALLPPLDSIEEDKEALVDEKSLKALWVVIHEARQLLAEQLKRNTSEKLWRASETKERFRVIEEQIGQKVQTVLLSVSVKTSKKIDTCITTLKNELKCLDEDDIKDIEDISAAIREHTDKVIEAHVITNDKLVETQAKLDERQAKLDEMHTAITQLSVSKNELNDNSVNITINDSSTTINTTNNNVITNNVVHTYNQLGSSSPGKPENYRRRRTRLHEAAENGSLEEVQLALSKYYIDHEMADKNGTTALLLATRRGDNQIIKLLLDEGVDFEVTANKLAWIHAFEKEDSKIILLFIDGGSDVNQEIQFQHGMTNPLHLSAQLGHQEVVRALIGAGADVNAKRKNDGNTPLHISAFDGHLEVVRALIEARAEVNAKTNCGWFTLHWSAAKGHLEVVRALIEAGADVNVKADDGWTPLHMSASNQLLDIARYLIEKGADVNAKRKYDGKTPLHISAERGQLEVVRVLIDAGADVNAKNNNGETPLHESLHASAIYGDEEIARALIEAGADVNDRASNGESALHVSANKGHLEFARVLIDNGAELNIKKVPGSNWHCGFTPLHFCASNGHLEFARALIEAGADVNAKDLNTENWTPLHESIKYGHLEVARALIEAGADVDAKTTDCSLDDVDFGVGHSTPLHFCAGKGKFISVKFLLMNGASLHHKNADGFTQLDCLKSNFDAVTLTNLFSQMEKKWLVNWILSLGN